jgi:hypothetical protein
MLHKELRGSEVVWLNQKFSQPSLEPFVLSFYMMDHSGLCNMLVGDLECVHVVLERSPPYLFLYLFYLIKKNKKEINKGSTI